MLSRTVLLISSAITLGCYRAPLASTQSPGTLGLYEAVLRAVTADYPRNQKPPVERRVMAWRSIARSQAPDSEPPMALPELPDTFVVRLTHQGVVGGLCPHEGCRRVPSAITLSTPRAMPDGLILVQASLQGTGLDQYVVRREATRWIVVRREEQLVY